jgi:hypothetical protein
VTQQFAAGRIQRCQAAGALVFYPAMMFDLRRWFDEAALGVGLFRGAALAREAGFT